MSLLSTKFMQEKKLWGLVRILLNLTVGISLNSSGCVAIHGMEPWLVREALKVLEHEGKAAIIAGETCEEDGVKFLTTN